MMATDRVGDMTIEELKALVEKVVERRMGNIRQLGSKRSVQEVLDDIDKHLWTPPAGTPSVIELIREDRDR